MENFSNVKLNRTITVEQVSSPKAKNKKTVFLNGDHTTPT